MKIIPFLNQRYVQVKRLVDDDALPCGAFIYLNPFNYFFLRKNPWLLNVAYYRMDGIYLVSIMRLYLSKALGVVRQSFDMTSLAPVILNYCAQRQLKVFIAGGKPGHADAFISIMTKRFPGIEWVGHCDGYQSEQDVIDHVLDSRAEVALLGLGNIKQESVAGQLAQQKPEGRFFTCGAFISQTASARAVDYYPRWINRYHLRWAYRFAKEPHVIKRVAKFYPVFLIIFVYDVWWG